VQTIVCDWNGHPLTLLTKENKNIIISKWGSGNFNGKAIIIGWARLKGVGMKDFLGVAFCYIWRSSEINQYWGFARSKIE